MKEPFGLFLELDTLYMKNVFKLLGPEEPWWSKGCINHETNPECLNELFASRETTYTLRGKDCSNYFNSIYESSF